ncbi:plasmid replication protein RepC [Leisingera sp.]|uniref:plasmid replication protein RepC n=1 Tax=Leisingera sp. TaxID=1879318 RepID=UPI002B27184D|nr:plasmid replication protein RepC [Leisingera sp.]
MGYMPITPFGRTVDAVLLKQQAATEKAHLQPAANKWDALRELAAARKTYGLSDRDISVLQALLSFLPGKMLDRQNSSLVIHPSNKVICERLNGMPCSTMRRHVAKLVEAGILIRRDSPNGKRYVRRYQGERMAFGFDLSPLAVRFAEFSDAAETERAAQMHLRQLRETVSLMRRDLASLALCGEAERPDLNVWDQFHDMARLTARALRRKLGFEELQKIQHQLAAGLKEASAQLEPDQAEEMSTSDAQNEQHYQNSTKDSYESEQAAAQISTEEPKAAKSSNKADTTETAPVPDNQQRQASRNMPKLPLRLILSACGEIKTYADGAICHWHDLVKAANTIRPMMGISSAVWEEAKHAMGAAEASVVISAMLERFGEIRSPGAYLRHLSAKATSGHFSSGPMVMALVRQEAA